VAEQKNPLEDNKRSPGTSPRFSDSISELQAFTFHQIGQKIKRSKAFHENDFGSADLINWFHVSIFLLHLKYNENGLLELDTKAAKVTITRLCNAKESLACLATSCTGILHAVEFVCARVCPEVYQCLCGSGMPVGYIAKHWIAQGFWGYLNGPELLGYAVLLFTHGQSYQVYFVVSILKHLEKQLLAHAMHSLNGMDLCEYVLNVRLSSFRINDHIDSMIKMEKDYGQVVTQLTVRN